MEVFDRKLPIRDREGFRQKLIHINYIRTRNMSFLLFIICALLIVFFDISNHENWSQNIGYRILFYLHLFLGTSMIIFGGLSWSKLRSPSLKITTLDKLLDWAFGLCVAVTCALFAVNDQLIDKGITLYILGLFIVAVVNYMNSVKSLSIYLISYIVYFVGISKLQTNEIILRGQIVNGAIVLVIAWFISLALYYGMEKDYIARRTIEKQKYKLEKVNNDLEQAIYALNESLLALDESQNMICTLALAIESKDRYTRGHSERVVEYSLALADYLGLSKKDKMNLKNAAILHDTGKIGIPDRILNKPSKLTNEEWEIMKSHPEQGQMICSKLKFAQEILPIIRHHHERFDGKGYPDGLKGENIPFLARIVAIADMVDAITSERPYRPAQSLEIALQELQKDSGTQFDPLLAEAFIDMCRKGNSNLDNVYVM